MRNPRPTTFLLAVLAIAVAFAGCGSSSDDTTTDNSPASTSAAPHPIAPAGVRAKGCKGETAAEGEIRVTGVTCAEGRLLVSGWHKNSTCVTAANASRSSCRLGTFQCLGVTTDRGIAVTCAAPNRSIAFVAKPD